MGSVPLQIRGAMHMTRLVFPTSIVWKCQGAPELEAFPPKPSYDRAKQ